MEHKHTPGEWRIGGISQEDGSVSIAKGQIVLCYVTNAASFFDVVQGRHPDAQFANARLIAAAPDLLEALIGYMNASALAEQAMKDGVNVHGAVAGLIGWTDMAHAAIARATGETKEPA